MKQKRLLAFLLVLVMTASVLAGCGASSVNKDMAMPEAAAPMEAPMKNNMVMAGSAVTADTIRQESGQKLMKSAYPIRILVLAGVLIACAASGYFDVLALLLPLLFVRPVIMILGFFEKKGA